MRGEALRQMSPFESDSKTKMRELDACALQLERMIEQMRGVEYATVGVRARKEVVGLSSKNIVTASVGVAAKDDFELDSNALTAITITTQRLLGIEDSKNVAILDLKEGKSYLGCDNVKERCDDLALVSEREWTEKYWRNKYLEAFSDSALTCFSDSSSDLGICLHTQVISSVSFICKGSERKTE